MVLDLLFSGIVVVDGRQHRSRRGWDSSVIQVGSTREPGSASRDVSHAFSLVT